MLFAVNTAAVATPEAFVVAVFTPPANVPLAPLPGAVKVTVTPLTRLPKESLTVACNCTANAVFTVPLCGVPAVAVMLAAAPATLLNVKLACVPTPVTEAVTT
jgi:hypothetical protein